MSRSIGSDSKRGPGKADEDAAWILCRNLEEFPVYNDLALQTLAEKGRILPDDYLVNCELDTCSRAKDVEVLRIAFRKAAIGRVKRISRLLARAMAAIWRIERDPAR